MYTILKHRNRPRSATDTRTIHFNFIGFLILAAVWQIGGYIRASLLLPPLEKVLRAVIFLIRDRAFFQHIKASLQIILLGISMAVVIGFIAGVLIFRYERLKAALLPVIECARGIAAITLFPLLLITSGIGTFSRVFIIFWTAWPAIIISTIGSLKVDQSVIDAAPISGASEWGMITHIRIPMALQGIITGIRIGFGGGWVSLVTAEMLGASKGMGFYLLWCSQSFEFNKVYAVIIIIAAVGGLMNLALLSLQKRAYLITGEST
jgi:ABC-type nitrate/sulfonate/bicarbonate transport system permease component